MGKILTYQWRTKIRAFVSYLYPKIQKKVLQSIDYKTFKVPGAGLEPAQPQWPQDFKSCVSTSSTTRAKIVRTLKLKVQSLNKLWTLCFGAKDETRTRDPNLGKVMLYQLSYFRILFWWCKNIPIIIISKISLDKIMIIFLKLLNSLIIFKNWTNGILVKW